MFEPDLETMGRGQIERLQNKKLRYLINRSYQKTKIYHNKFKGLNFQDVKGSNDIAKLPFTSKNDLLIK